MSVMDEVQERLNEFEKLGRGPATKVTLSHDRFAVLVDELCVQLGAKRHVPSTAITNINLFGVSIYDGG